jgi:SpoVK/Ycf46/Vps4 family AAA+-type ATPase
MRRDYEILGILTQSLPLGTDVDLGLIAQRTHGFTGADLEALCSDALYERVKHRGGDQEEIIASANKMLKITWFMLARRELYESRNEKHYRQKLNSIAA